MKLGRRQNMWNADVNARNKNGQTNLMLAAESGNVKQFQRLLNEPKIRIDIEDNAGKKVADYVREYSESHPEHHEIADIYERYINEFADQESAKWVDAENDTPFRPNGSA